MSLHSDMHLASSHLPSNWGLGINCFSLSAKNPASFLKCQLVSYVSWATTVLYQKHHVLPVSCKLMQNLLREMPEVTACSMARSQTLPFPEPWTGAYTPHRAVGFHSYFHTHTSHTAFLGYTLLIQWLYEELDFRYMASIFVFNLELFFFLR